VQALLLSASFLAATLVGHDPGVAVLLADRADAVVVGILDGGSCGVPRTVVAPVRRRLITLRVLKGDLEAPGSIEISESAGQTAFPRASYGGQGQSSGGHSPQICSGLWFLRHEENGEWRVMPASERGEQIPAPAAPLPHEWTYASGAPLLDKLFFELRAAFDSSEVVIASTAADIIRDIRTSLSPGPRTFDAETADTQRTAELLRRHFADPAHAERCIAARTLREWDVLVVERLAAWAAGGDTSAGPATMLWFSLYDVTDPRTVPTLARLLETVQMGSLGSSPPVCGASVPQWPQDALRPYDCYEATLARALRNIHTEETLPLLSRLLDSPDPETQYMALQGTFLAAEHCPPGTGLDGCPHSAPADRLDEFEAFNRHYPAAAMFGADRAEYVDFWKRWHAKHRSGLP
jgi:hypothetical protein